MRLSRIYILLLLLSLATGLQARLQNLVINELMAAIVSYMLDDTYNYGGWVELYNNSRKSINLAGYSLSDDASNPRKYEFFQNAGVLAPGEYKIIYFDNHGLNAYHVDFKLDADGSALYLYDAAGVSIDHVEYSFAYPETSYARKGDAEEEWSTCITPSPGATNNGAQFSVKRASKPRANTPAGLYSDNIMVELSSDGGTIKYTIDGSEPDNRSAVWSGRMYIGETTVLRARTFKKGCIPSEIFTATYVIDRDRTITLPIISITTDPDNLWDDTIGIYCEGTNGESGNGVSYPANWNRDWRRPANVEIINNPHDRYFSQQCDISIGGGYSRAYPLKSIELNAEKKYEGRNSFDVRLFAQKPYYRFKSLNLRNSGNDFYSSMCRDAFQQCIYAGTVDVDYLAYQPAVHFINGEYYGIINIRERSNHHHAYSNWGYEKEDIDVVYNSASGSEVAGDDTALERLLALVGADVTDASYKEILTLIDVDEYINYIVVQSFSGNSDWMSNNVKFYRYRNGGGFRWVLFDLDHGFSSLSYNQFTATDRSGLTNVRVPTGRIFQSLIKYAPFRDKFIAHATAVIGGAVREERVQSIIDDIYSRISGEMPYHAKRWSTDGSLASQCKQYVQYAADRTEVYARQMADYFSMGEPAMLTVRPTAKTALYVDGVEVPTGVFEGYVSRDRSYRLSVEVPYGYKFS
ncbi:MAG: CotH kinase family protein, partial [Bacteroidaceae bacterium]|nr:CotH kinase family protein [Bacteroidaceae bacterium]